MINSTTAIGHARIFGTSHYHRAAAGSGRASPIIAKFSGNRIQQAVEETVRMAPFRVLRSFLLRSSYFSVFAWGGVWMLCTARPTRGRGWRVCAGCMSLRRQGLQSCLPTLLQQRSSQPSYLFEPAKDFRCPSWPAGWPSSLSACGPSALRRCWVMPIALSSAVFLALTPVVLAQRFGPDPVSLTQLL